nr:MAG TPA: hypothetical protein [Bacteriophage sp.]
MQILFLFQTENNKIESRLLYSLIYENDIIFPPDFLTTHKA